MLPAETEVMVSALCFCVPHAKMSDVSLGTRPRDSLMAGEGYEESIELGCLAECLRLTSDNFTDFHTVTEGGGGGDTMVSVSLWLLAHHPAQLRIGRHGRHLGDVKLHPAQPIGSEAVVAEIELAISTQ